jgi:putative methyltransferase (TIGR04325 family)
MHPALKKSFPFWLFSSAERKKRRRRKKDNIWEGNYPDWESAAAAADGYDSAAILEKVYGAALAVRDGKALWERDSVLFYEEAYNWPLVAGLMHLAAVNKGTLRVLDFGGAFGSTYMQNRVLLDKLQHVEWHIVEQPHIVDLGRKEFSSSVLHFWHNIEDCLDAHEIDVILFSSVLQYMQNPYEIISKAVKFNTSGIIIDRTPFAEQGERITIQHVPEKIYKANYVCYFLNKLKVKAILETGFHCLPEFASTIDESFFSGIIAIREKNYV